MSDERRMSDEEWAERLSAYLDGEVDDAERRAVERALEADPVRAAQLEELRRTVGDLSAWDVTTPRAPRRLVESLSSGTATIAPPLRFDRRRAVFAVLRYAAVLAVGVFLGVTLTGSGSGRGIAPALPANVSVATHPAIPADTSEALLREVAVSAKENQVRMLIREGRFHEAAQEYKGIEGDASHADALPAQYRDIDQRAVRHWRAFYQPKGI